MYSPGPGVYSPGVLGCLGVYSPGQPGTPHTTRLAVCTLGQWGKGGCWGLAGRTPSFSLPFPPGTWCAPCLPLGPVLRRSWRCLGHGAARVVASGCGPLRPCHARPGVCRGVLSPAGVRSRTGCRGCWPSLLLACPGVRCGGPLLVCPDSEDCDLYLSDAFASRSGVFPVVCTLDRRNESLHCVRWGRANSRTSRHERSRVNTWALSCRSLERSSCKSGSRHVKAFTYSIAASERRAVSTASGL